MGEKAIVPYIIMKNEVFGISWFVFRHDCSTFIFVLIHHAHGVAMSDVDVL